MAAAKKTPKEPTGPLPLVVHQALGAVCGESNQALLVCFDRANLAHSKRIARIRKALWKTIVMAARALKVLEEYEQTLKEIHDATS